MALLGPLQKSVAQTSNRIAIDLDGAAWLCGPADADRQQQHRSVQYVTVEGVADQVRQQSQHCSSAIRSNYRST